MGGGYETLNSLPRARFERDVDKGGGWLASGTTVCVAATQKLKTGFKDLLQSCSCGKAVSNNAQSVSKVHARSQC